MDLRVWIHNMLVYNQDCSQCAANCTVSHYLLFMYKCTVCRIWGSNAGGHHYLLFMHKCTVCRIEVLTPVVMKSTIFWDITSCSPLSVKRCFGRSYRLHLQGRKNTRARNQHESRWKGAASTLVSCSLIFSTLKMERNVPPKRRLTLNRLHGVISQKMVLFKCTICFKTHGDTNPTCDR
jgi:hypothetical protein